MTATIRSWHFANGLVAEMKDETFNYFGDYHNIKLVIYCRIPVQEAYLDPFRDRLYYHEVRKMLDGANEYRREIVKAGVAGKDLDATKSFLIDSFEKNALIYFERDDFPRLFTEKKFLELEEELTKKKRREENGG